MVYKITPCGHSRWVDITRWQTAVPYKVINRLGTYTSGSYHYWLKLLKYLCVDVEH